MPELFLEKYTAVSREVAEAAAVFANHSPTPAARSGCFGGARGTAGSFKDGWIADRGWGVIVVGRPARSDEREGRGHEHPSEDSAPASHAMGSTPPLHWVGRARRR